MKVVAFVMPWHISERGGGAEVQANYLAQELGNRGYQVSYICQTTNTSQVNSVQKEGHIFIHYLMPSGRFPWIDQNKYLEPLKAIKPDFILQRLSSNVTYVLGKYSKQHNCKLVWFCTDNKNPIRNFHSFKFKEYSSSKSLGIFKNIVFALNSRIMDFYRVRGMKHVDIAFTQNDYQKEQVNRNFNLKSERMISGHPLPEHTISKTQRFKNKTILWCANWGTHKRPEFFIELASKMQHTNFKFIMVGGHSNKHYVDQLLSNKPKNLTVTGRLSFDDALSYFDKASIFVNTSSPGGDGFPNTFIQSWLRETPVVSFGFDPDGIVLTNNLGYNVGSIDEAIQKISTMMNDYETYKVLSQNAYDYGCKNHTIKVMTDHFLEVIKKSI